MGVRKTQEQFLKEAYALHGDHYDFSKSVYTSSKDKMSVFCNIHHKFFTTTPNQILKGSGCPECGLESRIAKRTDTTESFIAKARKVHGDKYDYSKVVYEKSDIPVTITCKKCGQDFKQSPNTHLMGHGCRFCASEENSLKQRMPFADFLAECRKHYGEKYDYSKVQYVNGNSIITVICPKHGEFTVPRGAHAYGERECPCCERDKKRPTIYDDLGIIDDGYMQYTTASHKKWIGIIHRCYNKSALKKRPTYQGCGLCEEWKTFSVFKKWFDENYVEGYELEKDILVKGNKIYGPDTCCFVPRRINILITNRKRFRGTLPVGVRFSKSKKKYIAEMERAGGKRFIGYFDTAEEAFHAYKNAKEAYIKEVADEYFSKGLITKRVRDALYQYKIEITD